MIDEVFRFTLVRPPQRRASPPSGAPEIPAYSGGVSNFAGELAEAPPDRAAAMARELIGSDRYVADFASLEIPLADLDAALLPPSRIDDELARRAVEDVFGAKAKEVVKTPAFRGARERLADSLLAAVSSGRKYSPGQQRLVRGLQLLAAVEALADPDAGPQAAASALRGLVVLPKQGARVRAQTPQQPPANPPQDVQGGLAQIDRGRRAIAELEAVRRRKRLRIAALGPMAAEEQANLPSPERLESEELEALSESSREYLSGLELSTERLHIRSLTRQLEEDLDVEKQALVSSLHLIPGLIFVPGFVPAVPSTVGRVRVAGIGDLLIVRQQIKRYELGEIAHIENALRGESYGRTFRRKEDVEIVELEEIEQAETTERDLQSTSKYELKTEAERTIQEDLRFEAGVTVTARGPAVEVNANAGFSYERSTEDARRTASTFARDVVDRSVSRLQERVLQRRSSRVSTEVEETSEHRIDNSGAPDHLIGIYRWVEKIYEAQIVNYGQRLLLEFVVPEPAAFHRRARQDQRPPGVIGEPPVAPETIDERTGERRPLTVEDISGSTYLDWVGRYDVVGVEPPPPPELFVGMALEQGDKGEDKEAVSTVVQEGGLKVEPGYRAAEIRVDHAGAVAERGYYWELVVGTHQFISRRPADDGEIGFTSPMVVDLTATGIADSYDDTIPVSLVVKNYDAFTVNVVVRCDRTQSRLDEWKLATYTSIMSRYHKLKADYDDEVAAAQIQDGVGISGRNPLANREIERNELKRASIAMITGQNFDLFGAMSDSGEPLRFPQVVNFAEAEAEGEYIQFLEQAFEWRHMTYVFYPYFWGRKNRWLEVLADDDVDPLFAQFLRAGAARVQVPVRPGFVDAMDFFLKHGRPWLGGDPPHFEEGEGGGEGEDGGGDGELDRPPFIPIIQELREQIGAEFEDGLGEVQVTPGSPVVFGVETLFEAPRDVDREIRIGDRIYRIRDVVGPEEINLYEPYAGEDSETLLYSIGPKLVGQPWEVRLPTTLVILQQEDDLPTF